MMGAWRRARRRGCGEGFEQGRWYGMHGGGHGDDAGHFGVRRPLRYLAYRLELDESQTAEVARILDELKTERAQVAVDERRAVSAFADALSGEALDSAKLGEAAASRVRSAERLRDAVVTALGRIHAVLDPEQRKQFAFLIRTGAVQF
jgi:Spy/CpxP family protein refolding chaperone